MIKRFYPAVIILTIFIFSVFHVSAEIGDLRVKYRPNTMTGNQMGFYFTIENVSGASVALADVKVFYYFTTENSLSPQLFNTGAYGNNLEMIYEKNLYPHTGATDILEFNFTVGAGNLGNNSESGEMHVWITDGVSTSANDFSYDGSIPSGGQNQYNSNIAVTHKGELVWGSDMGIVDQSSIVGGGWYLDASSQTELTNNYKLRNDDLERVELLNDAPGTKIVFDFKDIAVTTKVESIERITLRIKHFEDIGFDNNDFLLSVGSGLKPGETANVWATTYMPALPTQSGENYFEWDVTSVLNTLTKINDAELKIEIDTGAPIGIMTRYNRVYMAIEYNWPGKYPANAITFDQDNLSSVDLSFGYAWVSLPQSSGTLTISSGRGFDIHLEGYGSPASSFPGTIPYYTASYTINSSLVKITRINGDRGISLKYSN